MKYLKKKSKKKKNGLVIALAVCMGLLVIAAAVAVALHFAGTGSKDPGQEPVTQTDPVKATGSAYEIPQAADLQELEVVSDYGTFQLSGYWHGEMRADITDEDGYTISVYGQIGSQQEQHIFDVCFGGTEGDHIGYVYDKNGEPVAVSIVLSAFEPDDSWTEQEKQEFYGMQSELNSIIGHLELVSEEEIGSVSDEEAMQIETPYVTLVYSGAYSDRIRTEISGEDVVTVRFFGTPSGVAEVYLFDIIFGGNAENAVGFYTADDGSAIAVEVQMGAASTDGWSDEPVAEYYVMMDSINDLLFQMENEGSFRFS